MKNKSITNEVELLLSCIKTKVNTSLIETILKKSIDWQLVIEKAISHEVLPLLYHNIAQLESQKVPQNVLTISKNSYYFTLARNIYLWKEFCSLQNIFHSVGIKIIPLKGIILSKILYHNVALRPMQDIDILIQQEDLLFAKKQLQQLGYQPYLKNLTEEYWKKYHCHFAFININKNIIVELHWALAPPRPNKIDIREAWQRSKIQIIDQAELSTLSPEDTLLSLCLHICKNVANLEYIKLKNLNDIHELMIQYDKAINWNYIVDQILFLRLKGNFFYIYLLTKAFFGTYWPPNLISIVKPGTVRTKILFSNASNFRKKTCLQSYWLMLVMLDTKTDCLNLILQKIAMVLQKISFAISTLKHDKQK